MTLYSVIAISVGPEYFTEADDLYLHLRTVGLVAACFVRACSLRVNFTTISLNVPQTDVRFIVRTKTNIEQGTLDLKIFISDANQELRAGRLEVSFDEAGVDFIFDEKVVGEDIKADGYRRFNWLDNKFPQSPSHCGNGFSSRSLMDNKLGNHRIVFR